MPQITISTARQNRIEGVAARKNTATSTYYIPTTDVYVVCTNDVFVCVFFLCVQRLHVSESVADVNTRDFLAHLIDRQHHIYSHIEQQIQLGLGLCV